MNIIGNSSALFTSTASVTLASIIPPTGDINMLRLGVFAALFLGGLASLGWNIYHAYRHTSVDDD